VVRVEEVQHLPGVRADDLGSPAVIGRGAEQSGEPTELAPDDAVDENHLVGIDAGPAEVTRCSGDDSGHGVSLREGVA
jgi:hypothetical protein